MPDLHEIRFYGGPMDGKTKLIDGNLPKKIEEPAGVVYYLEKRNNKGQWVYKAGKHR